MSFYPTTDAWVEKIRDAVMKRMAEDDNAFPRFQGGVVVGGRSARKYKKAPGVKRHAGARKASPWVQFVKEVWAANPGMSYKDAMVLASKMRKGGVSVGGKFPKGKSKVIHTPGVDVSRTKAAVKAARPKKSARAAIMRAIPDPPMRMMLPPPEFEEILAEMPAPPALGGSRKAKLASYHALVREIRLANPQMSYNQAQKAAAAMRRAQGGVAVGGVAVGGAAAMQAELAVEPPRMGVSDSRAQRAAKGKRQTAQSARDSRARAKVAKGGVAVGGMSEDYMRQHIRAALEEMAKEGGVSVGGVKKYGKKSKMPKTALSRQRLAEIMSGRV